VTSFQVSYAAALTGFVYRKGSAVPNLQGIVVACQCEELVRAACVEDAIERSRRYVNGCIIAISSSSSSTTATTTSLLPPPLIALLRAASSAAKNIKHRWHRLVQKAMEMQRAREDVLGLR
jgi:hypothetical protein